MKKNFFKKLSFVMALAMIISVIAPAAGAFAATKSSLNATSKVLYLGTKNNKFDFNIKNHVKGSTYSWTIADKKVATVHSKYGMVTAVAPGSTKVTAKVTPKTGKAYTLSAKVIVRDNIKEVKITNVPEADLKVGQENDFNRTFKTVSGSTTRTLSVTRWLVDGEGATIDAKTGVFKATVPGEYKVKAVSFETDAQFDAWKADSEKNASKLLASDEVTVKVVPSVVATKQVDADTFTVEFDSDMSKTDILKEAILYKVVAGKDVNTGAEKIKKITLDSTGKIATVDMFTAFVAGTDYKFAYGKLTGTFKAATKNVSDIAGLVFDDFTVTIGRQKDMLDAVYAVNKDGVKILSGSEIAGYLGFTYGGDKQKGNTAGQYAYIYEAGYSAPVTAKFSNHIYDTETKQFVNIVFEDVAVALGVTADVIESGSLQFEVVDDTNAPSDTNWDGTLSLAAKDTGFKIRARYKTNTNTAYQYTADNTKFKYEPSDSSKLLIYGTEVYPVAAGSVTILVKDVVTNAVVTTFDILISPARTVGTAVPGTQSMTIGNHATLGEEGKDTIVVKDSMGAEYTPSVTHSFVNKPVGANDLQVTLTPSKGKVNVSVFAKGATVGAYNLKVTLSAFGATQDVYYSIIVLDGNSANVQKVVRWDVELDSTNVDLKTNYGKDVNVDVFGYNTNNVRVARLTHGTHYTVSVTNGSNTEVASGSAVISVVGGVSGSAVTRMPIGTYTVTVSLTQAGIDQHFVGSGRVAPSYLGAKAFNVEDTTRLDKKFDALPATSGTAIDIAKAAYTLVLNETDLNDNGIVAVTYSIGTGRVTVTSAAPGDAIPSGTDVFIESITYRVIDPATSGNTGRYIDYVFPINNIVAVK